MNKDGIIIKGIGGFYYVEAAGQVYECKAKGIFRKEGKKPVAGDFVTISINEGAENTIDVIRERTSELMRPPVANISRLFIIASTVEPAPVPFIIDKLTAIAVSKNIEPIVVFTKCDMAPADEFAGIYRSAGIKTFCVSNKTGEGIEAVKPELEGHISAFAGNSGVGKSSLLNAIDPALGLKTAEISAKLGRGKHTTRHSELFKMCGGYVADTPGFASIVSEESEYIPTDILAASFPEFEDYLGQCRFSSCRHEKDKGCRILEAVEAGDISTSRHSSYVALLQQAEAREEQLKKSGKK
ncbi:MAG: ribosome small subunit-dependent GTPase A [Clostridia bacterium]|nr:ribosome small subunit-dependent GTPase A [Clostridia bacterium]